jgi:hypothetical protein
MAEGSCFAGPGTAVSGNSGPAALATRQADKGLPMSEPMPTINSLTMTRATVGEINDLWRLPLWLKTLALL